jgi:hypothetical protein
MNPGLFYGLEHSCAKSWCKALRRLLGLIGDPPLNLNRGYPIFPYSYLTGHLRRPERTSFYCIFVTTTV